MNCVSGNRENVPGYLSLLLNNAQKNTKENKDDDPPLSSTEVSCRYTIHGYPNSQTAIYQSIQRSSLGRDM